MKTDNKVMTIPDYFLFLRSVENYPNSSASDIQIKTGITYSHLHKIKKILNEKGMITVIKKDKRTLLNTTMNGKEIVKKINELFLALGYTEQKLEEFRESTKTTKTKEKIEKIKLEQPPVEQPVAEQPPVEKLSTDEAINNLNMVIATGQNIISQFSEPELPKTNNDPKYPFIKLEPEPYKELDDDEIEEEELEEEFEEELEEELEEGPELIKEELEERALPGPFNQFVKEEEENDYL